MQLHAAVAVVVEVGVAVVVVVVAMVAAGSHFEAQAPLSVPPLACRLSVEPPLAALRSSLT